MERQLNSLLGLYALLDDFENAGFLSGAEAQDSQRADLEFGVGCQRVALDFLKLHGDGIMACQALARQIDQQFQIVDASDEERDLVQGFADRLESAIIREAEKSRWQRNATRIFLKVPGILWVLLAAITVTAIGLAVRSLTQ